MSQNISTSILVGVEIAVEPKFLHRLFEENIIKNGCEEELALIYEGKNLSMKSHQNVSSIFFSFQMKIFRRLPRHTSK
jgi:hypothetical protein